ncbi:MAG: hypothetical protein HY779_04600 [Rubrobacteridae bacterium]|nr:hypothetical protein [Rubrobacteridae bacterium]
MLITFPVNVLSDMDIEGIQPNMAATANIITETKDNVILIPSGAAKTSGGQSTVTILKNKQPQQVTVELGISSDTQIEVISGVSEGDAVVTASSSSTQQATSSSGGSSSPFAGGGMMGGPPGMGAVSGQRSSGSSSRSGSTGSGMGR